MMCDSPELFLVRDDYCFCFHWMLHFLLHISLLLKFDALPLLHISLLLKFNALPASVVLLPVYG
jgi:hypothetical protein